MDLSKESDCKAAFHLTRVFFLGKEKWGENDREKKMGKNQQRPQRRQRTKPLSSSALRPAAWSKPPLTATAMARAAMPAATRRKRGG